MEQIANFFTLFWIVYFPTCIVFQSQYGIEWMDELLCFVLVVFAFLYKRRWQKDIRYNREFKGFMGIMLFYIFYSILIQVTSIRGIFLDFLQQIRPYFVFYITYFLAPSFSPRQKRMIVWSMMIAMIAYFFIGRNVGYVDGQAEDGTLPMIALTCGMSYYLFMKPTKRNLYIAIVIMLIGLFSGKSKYIGQCICFIGMVVFLRQHLKSKSLGMYIGVIVLISTVLYFTWTKFSGYYVEGFQATEVAEMAARPATYRTAGKILLDYFPFGSGLGSFCTAAAAKEYSPLYFKYGLSHILGLSPDYPAFIADCYFPGLAEFGFVGIFFFLVFWKRRLKDINQIQDMHHYRMALMSVLALAIDSTANTAYLSGMGMGLFMTLAICLQSNRTLEINQIV